MKLAIIIRGATFFRSLGTIIYFSKNVPSLAITVCIQRQRRGKEYDSLTPEEVQLFAPHVKVVSFEDDNDVILLLKKIGAHAVLTQDPYHQFPNIFGRSWSVYSLAVFVDSLHYAWRLKSGQARRLIPQMTYFPCDYIRDRFIDLSGYTPADFPHMVLGAPQFDHDLFLPALPTPERTVVVIAPPPNLTGWLLLRRLKRLLESLRHDGWRIIIKDRIKTPFSTMFKGVVDEWHTQETLMPYESLRLIKQSSVHVCGYSTSIFEARYYNKPTLNLDIALSNHTSGNFIQTFGLTDLYNSRTCITASWSLSTAWQQLLNVTAADVVDNEKFLAPNQHPTMDNNASLRILRHILSHYLT